MSETKIFGNIKAVYFDYDNTLVEFDSVSQKALIEVAKDMFDYITENYPKLKVSLEELTSTLFSVSKSLDEEGVFDRKEWWLKTLERFEVKPSNEELYSWTQLYWSIAGKNEPYADAIDAIEYLKAKGYKVGLITNSDGEGGDKKARISRFPLISKFDVIIIGGEGNVSPKPNPQPFLLACEKLGLKVSECVMVGDDPVKDCLAAKKAGMKAILVDRAQKVKHAELYADYVISNLSTLSEMF